jgi:hypothetical protein
VRLVSIGAAGLCVALVLGLLIRINGEPQAAAETTPATAAAPLAAPSQSTTPTPTTSTAMLSAGQDVLVLGDSLALSTYAWLADLMPDRYVSWEAQVGRTTAEARVALAARLAAGDVPPVIVVSSGTNDVAASDLRREAVRILALAGPTRCVVWADVVRPDSFGDGSDAPNVALAAAWRGHDNVVPVRWTTMVSEHPEWLTSDGVHPDEAGNIARARAFADAVLSCSPLDPDAPRASQQYLPGASFLAPGGGSVPGVGSGVGTGAGSSPSRSSTKQASPRTTTTAPAPSETMAEQPTSAPPTEAPQSPTSPPESPDPHDSGTGLSPPPTPGGWPGAGWWGGGALRWSSLPPPLAPGPAPCRCPEQSGDG